MAEITASMVKELREKTGAGMMDCKSALNETGGDMEAAIDWLRTKGLAKDLKVVDWSPERPYAGLGLADRAMAAVGRMVGIDLSAWNGEGRLDGLVSVWHPQSSDLQ